MILFQGDEVIRVLKSGIVSPGGPYILQKAQGGMNLRALYSTNGNLISESWTCGREFEGIYWEVWDEEL